MERLGGFLAAGRPGVIRWGEHVAAALLRPADPLPAADLDHRHWDGYFNGLELPRAELELPLFDYPHDIVRYHLQAIGENLEDRVRRGGYREMADGVFLGARRHARPVRGHRHAPRADRARGRRIDRSVLLLERSGPRRRTAG